MKSSAQFTISLPACAQHPEGENTIQCTSSVVIVGANGAGKTRLGTWLEDRIAHPTLRISAQRAISFPYHHHHPAASSGKVSDAESHFTQSHKGGERGIDMQQGYQGLLVYLFAERTQVASKYHAEMLVAPELVRPPKCKLDRVIELWEAVLPHRQLTISDNQLHAGHKESSETFEARQLSVNEPLYH